MKPLTGSVRWGAGFIGVRGCLYLYLGAGSAGFISHWQNQGSHSFLGVVTGAALIFLGVLDIRRAL